MTFFLFSFFLLLFFAVSASLVKAFFLVAASRKELIAEKVIYKFCRKVLLPSLFALAVFSSVADPDFRFFWALNPDPDWYF